MSNSPPITARKSYSDGKITLSIKLNCGSWSNGRAKIDAVTDLSCEQARLLALQLTELADKADEKLTKKAEAKARREKWRDRETAAGRMIVLKGLKP